MTHFENSSDFKIYSVSDELHFNFLREVLDLYEAYLNFQGTLAVLQRRPDDKHILVQIFSLVQIITGGLSPNDGKKQATNNLNNNFWQASLCYTT